MSTLDWTLIEQELTSLIIPETIILDTYSCNTTFVTKLATGPFI